MKRRQFTRPKTRGFMSAAKALRTLYTEGPKQAMDETHFTIEVLLNKRYITNVAGLLTITHLGKLYIESRFYGLTEYEGE